MATSKCSVEPVGIFAVGMRLFLCEPRCCNQQSHGNRRERREDPAYESVFSALFLDSDRCGEGVLIAAINALIAVETVIFFWLNCRTILCAFRTCLRGNSGKPPHFRKIRSTSSFGIPEGRSRCVLKMSKTVRRLSRDCLPTTPLGRQSLQPEKRDGSSGFIFLC